MKKLIFLILALLSSSLFSQDTLYLKENYKETNDLSAIKYYKLSYPSTNKENVTIEKIYFLNDVLKFERKFKDYDSNKPKMVENLVYHDNGNLHIKSEYKKGKLHGHFLSYWPNGVLKRKDLYKKGKFKEGACWSEEGIKVDYYDFEIQPQFQGGKAALRNYIIDNLKNFETPSDLKGSKVIINFTINENGKIKNARVKKSVHPQIDQMALKVINEMPDWKSAKQDGYSVKVTRSIPLVF